MAALSATKTHNSDDEDIGGILGSSNEESEEENEDEGEEE